MKEFIVIFYLFILNVPLEVLGLGHVIYAVNCGGDSHLDQYGIKYEADPLNNVIGIASDHGLRYSISRVNENDQILYQTERYHIGDFGYNIPIKVEGEYVMVLMFSEVYFQSANQKVFDVRLHSEWTVVENLDIYAKVRHGSAHHEYIAFTIEGGKIKYDGQSADFKGEVRVDFIKGYYDNPKINAIYVVKGKLEDVPKLPPMDDIDEYEDEELMNIHRGPDSTTQRTTKRSTSKRASSGPRVPDPYADDDSSSLLPIVVALAAALPLLFCLCRL